MWLEIQTTQNERTLRPVSGNFSVRNTSMQVEPEYHCCSEHEFHAYLNDTLAIARVAEIEAHLSDCESCQCSLENAVSDAEDWKKTESLLRSDGLDLEVLSLASSGTRTIAPISQGDADLLSREIRGWLDPTDDPKMLGRFAGYEIIGVIGHGGMGIVLKGFESSLNRYVAIKVLAPRLATNGTARMRFAREARAAAAVLHENVIAIHRVDEWHGLPFLVMPYVAGVSLQKRIDEDGPLSIESTLRIGLQVATGLMAAHEQGLVHRDIKPANLLLDQGVDRVTITDFGLARAADDASMTRSGVIAGTPQYMSPEQTDGGNVDARSDLFSLGSVLYAMASGRPPFRGDGSFEVLKRVSSEKAKSLREIDSAIPVWFENLVITLHEKSAKNRPQSAVEVQKLLNACLLSITERSQSVPQELLSPSKRGMNRKRVAALGLFAIIVSVFLFISQAQFTQQNENAENASLVENAESKAIESLQGSGKDSQSEKSILESPDNDYGQPFTTPEELMAFIETRLEADDFKAFASQLTDDAAAELAGMVLLSASTVPNVDSDRRQNGEATAIAKELSDYHSVDEVMRRWSKPSPAANVTIVPGNAIRSNLVSAFGGSGIEPNNFSYGLASMRRVAETVTDHRRFSVEMMQALSNIADYQIFGNSGDSLTWHVQQSDDEAKIAILTQPESKGRDDAIPRFDFADSPNIPSDAAVHRIRLKRIDGRWLISSLIADAGIRWGDAVDGIRLGTRPVQFAKRSTRFRHGDKLDFEIWIRNDSRETILLPRDSAMMYRPKAEEKRINLLGEASYSAQFGSAQPATVLNPGQANRWMGTFCSIVSPDSEQVDDWPKDLRLAPGAYPMFAEVNVRYKTEGSPAGKTKKILLRSATTQIQVFPAAHLLVHSLYQPAKPRRGGVQRKVRINKDNGPGEVCTAYLDYEPIIDEDDILAVETRADDSEQQSFSVWLTLRSKATERLLKGGQRSHGVSLSGSRFGQAVFLDEELISTLMLRTPFSDNTMRIGSGLTLVRAEHLADQIRKLVSQTDHDLTQEKTKSSTRHLVVTGTDEKTEATVQNHAREQERILSEDRSLDKVMRNPLPVDRSKLSPDMEGRDVVMTFRIAKSFAIRGFVPVGATPTFGITPVADEAAPKLTVLVSGNAAKVLRHLRYHPASPSDKDQLEGAVVEAHGNLKVFREGELYQLSIRDWDGLLLKSVNRTAQSSPGPNDGGTLFANNSMQIASGLTQRPANTVANSAVQNSSSYDIQDSLVTFTLYWHTRKRNFEYLRNWVGDR
jgi:serine/threonine protein kinase